MALCQYFYRWTTIFFSISPDDYANALMDEIYGCFKYIGIPIDTIMNMPIQNRKYFIYRHNRDCDELNKSNNGDVITITGEATDVYSKISMTDYKHLK